MDETYRFTSDVYRWNERPNDSWYFVDVPEEQSAEIRDRPRMPRGFGSIRVEATIGATTWRTSIFPGGDRYALPLKKAVRDAEAIEPGEPVEVVIRDFLRAEVDESALAPGAATLARADGLLVPWVGSGGAVRWRLTPRAVGDLVIVAGGGGG
jgi:hypothetical protein